MSSTSQLKIGDYLFHRLSQLGIKTVFGVPGDYELALLDLIGDAGVRFSGNANELIAAYAADGYGRINGAGAFVTTYGPGELSAYCGHAGAYAEFVPVVHVVGYPGVEAMKNHTLMHHTLGTGEFDMYHEMVKHISVDTAVLTDASTAAADIDRCLNKMLLESRPVYIGVPVDMSHRQIDGSGLQTPLIRTLPESEKELLDKFIDGIWPRIKHARSPIILMDGNTVRNNLTAEANKLAELTGWPYFTTCMGKGGANEELSNYSGVYGGGGSIPEVRKAVEDDSDLVLWLGSFRTDFNTGELTDFVAETKTIDLQRFFTKIAGRRFEVGIHAMLPALIRKVEQDKSVVKTTDVKCAYDPYPTPSGAHDASAALTQDYLWSALPALFRSGDIIVGETGTSAFGLAASRYPKGAIGYNQTVFGSIGYAGPSAVGAFLAAHEAKNPNVPPAGRGILVTGEGSLQLTPMCIADFLKLSLKPIIFVLNNNGYTVERLIHGPKAFYNELPVWDYRQLSTVFGPKAASKYYGPVRTRGDLDDLLKDPGFRGEDCLQLVELILGELDAPASVMLTTKAIEAFNQKHAAKESGTSLGG
ncbi:hypothetical protein LTR62_000217 [Meristemomyces frigidus]|uniref:Pyruvate decarboxylase n=1 Tax=Meristemomyces frigidus TaxID=1508187 RepID=A0AAN7YUP4_9PEZI|nr:hypothetical protein LTR62_000217 [Meristemomyces frigidus]